VLFVEDSADAAGALVDSEGAPGFVSVAGSDADFVVSVFDAPPDALLE
jgi:hypothetical protein